jgi:uncharacterized protein (TIGR02646 family)
MLYIKKGTEPRSLSAHRNTPGATYDSLDKSETKNYLLAEQGHLCAYCMSRIRIDSMQIEHYIARSSDESRDLQYSNMLGVCSGNEGHPRESQTCDERRGNATLTVNPLVKSSIDTISYTPDARIKSTNAAIDHDLNENLNLNYSLLRRNRKEQLDKLKRWLQKKRPEGEWKPFAQKYIRELMSAEIKKPFCGILIDYLNKKLKTARS